LKRPYGTAEAVPLSKTEVCNKAKRFDDAREKEKRAHQ